MTTILTITLVLSGLLLTVRIIRTIPWRATLRLLATTILAVLVILAVVHFDIDIYGLIDTVLPDFGGTT